MVYVRGAFAHIKHVGPLMRGQRQGSMVNIGSVAGHGVGYVPTNYSLAKAAVIHLSRCAALELGEDNVRVNSISPGDIVTGIFGKSFGLDPDAADASKDEMTVVLAKARPIPRAGPTDDIANAEMYLSSDEAGFVNGTDIVVDGGMIPGRRFSEVVAGAQAMRTLFQ